MRRKIPCILFIFLISTAVFAEHVYLKNGTEITDCDIVKFENNTFIVAKESVIFNFPADRVKKIHFKGHKHTKVRILKEEGIGINIIPEILGSDYAALTGELRNNLNKDIKFIILKVEVIKEGKTVKTQNILPPSQNLKKGETVSFKVNLFDIADPVTADFKAEPYYYETN